MISVHDVSKTFPAEDEPFAALRDVSIEVPEGSLTALLGPSGSGKSTLLRVIAGLEVPDAGHVVIDGRDVTGVPPQDRGIGFVFQHYAAFKHMTAFENVAFGLRIRKVPKAEVRERVSDLMRLVGLEGFAERMPSQLSGGQRQRMALARALAIQPRVLLLDEPFGALDATVRRELREHLRRLHDEVHVTTVFVTHDQEEALEISDRVAVIKDGRIEQHGSPDDLYDRPATPFVMGFVGPTVRFGDHWVRPHDLRLSNDPEPGAVEVLVEKVARLGFEVRVEGALGDGEHVVVQVTRAEAEELELAPGQLLHLRAVGARGLPAEDGVPLGKAPAQPAAGAAPTSTVSSSE